MLWLINMYVQAVLVIYLYVHIVVDTSRLDTHLYIAHVCVFPSRRRQRIQPAQKRRRENLLYFNEVPTSLLIIYYTYINTIITFLSTYILFILDWNWTAREGTLTTFPDRWRMNASAVTLSNCTVAVKIQNINEDKQNNKFQSRVDKCGYRHLETVSRRLMIFNRSWSTA